MHLIIEFSAGLVSFCLLVCTSQDKVGKDQIQPSIAEQKRRGVRVNIIHTISLCLLVLKCQPYSKVLGVSILLLLNDHERGPGVTMHAACSIQLSALLRLTKYEVSGLLTTFFHRSPHKVLLAPCLQVAVTNSSVTLSGYKIYIYIVTVEFNKRRFNFT